MNIVKYRFRGSGGAVIGKKLCNINAEGSGGADFKKILWNTNAEGLGDADFEKKVEYRCRGVG